MAPSLPSSDRQLVQIMDAALADTARRSGAWLACRKGCTQCCHGPFAINQLDVARLRHGMRRLEAADPERAGRVRQRARESVQRLRPEFPGDPITGLLSGDAEAQERFETFADEEPCPALDPAQGTCDVYKWRPMTCRVFGPPVRSGAEGGLGVCELCYRGATDEQIAACEMKVPHELEAELLRKLERDSGESGETIVAYALLK